MIEEKLNKFHVFVLHFMFVAGVILGTGTVHFDNTQKWANYVARYIFYLFFIRVSHEAILITYKIVHLKQRTDLSKAVEANKTYMAVLGVAAAAILFYSKEPLFGHEFKFLFVAHVVAKYLEMEHTPTSIRYGIGMACSFFEGYLAYVLPSDGANFVGFEENIVRYEARGGIVFPVRKLFIVITKSLYCPPDLKQFNKPNRVDLPWLEPCESLEDVNKDVAGVKNRTYRNSAYKIHRPGGEPVYLAVECATPLHTLHKVLQRRALYDELKNIDVDEVVTDFCTMLQSIISKSLDCMDKCELVYYDDTNKELNLADLLLDKIRELEPNFENIRRE